MKVFVAIALLLLSANLNAQPKDFMASVFVNANGIHIEGDNHVFWQTDGGTIWGGGALSAGANIHKYISKNGYLLFELRYIQKGSIYEFTNEFGSQSYENFRLNYVEAPLLYGISFKPNDKVFRFELGLAFAKMFSSKLNIEEFANRNVNTNTASFKDLDVSGVATLKFPINSKGKENLLFGLRTSYSLIAIHEYYKLVNFVYGIQLEYVLNK